MGLPASGQEAPAGPDLNKIYYCKGCHKMTGEIKGSYAKKHSPDRPVDPGIAEAVQGKAKEGKISCAGAFGIVKNQGVSPSEVGFTVDSLEIKITKCQLGLFGYDHGKRPFKPAEKIPEELEKAIKKSLKEGRLHCASAWEIAERLRIGKMEITSACEKLKIKISHCQLGAF